MVAIVAMIYGEKRLVSATYKIFLHLVKKFVVWFSCIKGDFYIVRYFSCLNQAANFARPSGIGVEG